MALATIKVISAFWTFYSSRDVDVLHLTDEDLVRMPWRNGRGVSEEVAIWPQDAVHARGEGDWRLARTRFSAGGPFSRFDGFERLLVVTEGDGLVLDHGVAAPRRRLRRDETWRFQGEWDTTALLEGGEIADLNVLLKRDVVAGDLEVASLGERRMLLELEPEHTLVHLVAGRLRARLPGEEEAFTLEVGETLWVHAARRGDEAELLGLAPGTRAAVLRVRTVKPT